MRLINVQVILDIEDGQIDRETEALREFDDEELAQTRYAILSHCWGKDKEEVKFSELDQLARMEKESRDEIRRRPGYKKIVATCRQARSGGIGPDETRTPMDWVWVDTCCIDKSSSAELSEAINSMYRWYENAVVCYAFLQDVPDNTIPNIQIPCGKSDADRIRTSPFGRSRWFTRGWTLQELIAPRVVQFFNREWEYICEKTTRTVSVILEVITRIPWDVLGFGISANRPSAAEIMSWAADRKTRRVEDWAYSLLGLFGVYMPMIYGEGKNALRRLQLEIIRTSNDQSIFAWDPDGRFGRRGNVLADDPSFFRYSGRKIAKVTPTEFIRETLKLKYPELVSTRKALVAQSRSYVVTNAGTIQIWLPVRRCRKSRWLFQASLACSPSITITLALINDRHYRTHGNVDAFFGEPQLQELHLVYEEAPRTTTKFLLHDPLFHCNPVPRSYRRSRFRRYLFPTGLAFSGGNLMVSDNSHAVIVYVENELNFCFAFVLGCCFGQHWSQIVCDDTPMDGAWPQEADERRWEAYARAVHTKTEMTGLSNVNGIPDMLYSHVVTHTHIPRSIFGVRLVISKSSEPNFCRTWIHVTRCTGCCTSVHRPVSFSSQIFDAFDNHTTLKLYEEIRKQFRVLQKPYPQPAPQETAREQAADNGHYATEAMSFFATIFSAKRFQDWIGDIYFFSDLPSLLPIRTADGREILPDAHLTQDSGAMPDSNFCREGISSVESFSLTHLTSDAERESKALTELETRVKRLVTSLIEKLEPPDKFLDNEGIVEQLVCEAEDLKSEVFGIELLQLIGRVYMNEVTAFYRSPSSEQTAPYGDTIRSVMVDIEELEAILVGDVKHDELLALNEDIAGRILYLCWHGICCEVEQVLQEVVQRLLSDETISSAAWSRRCKALMEIGEVFMETTLDASDDQSPLRRIMADAQAGTSKYSLYLSAVQNSVQGWSYDEEESKVGEIMGHDNNEETE